MKKIFYAFLSITSFYLGCGWSANSFATSLDPLKEIYRAYDEAKTPGPTPDLLGLRVESLLKKGKIKEAKSQLEQSLAQSLGPKQAINWRLMKIAIEERRYGEFRKRLMASLKLGAFQNMAMMQEIYTDLPSSEKKFLVDRLIENNIFAHRFDSKCPFFELNKRKEKAAFLHKIIGENKLPVKINHDLLYELYAFLPEAIAISELKNLPGFDRFFKQLKVTDFIKRMELLLIFGKNEEARLTFLSTEPQHKKMAKADYCELAYLDAKIDRKLRKYDLARQKFKGLLVFQCPKEVVKKARFMDLMLASMTKDQSSLPAFNNFVLDYPADTLSDDVLVLKANLLLELSETDQALESLSQVIKQYPQGDMIYRALFLKGFTLAKLHKTKEALEIFEKQKQISRVGSLEYASAQYWIARLGIFPDLDNLKTQDKKTLSSKKSDLRKLLSLPNHNVYSWLAFSLLEFLGEKIDLSSLRHPKVTDPALDFNETELALLFDLAKHGFRTEALFLLDAIETKNDRNHNARIAILYDLLNHPEKAHQKLVRCEPALTPALSEKIPNIYQQIAYPRPFAREVSEVTKKINIAPSVIFAVMRQESGFLPEACSWAGAKGLMQLMFSSAREQNKALALGQIKEEDLYLPGLNILLGSSLLQAYWQRFSSLTVGLCAYNAGPSMAKVWLDKNKDVPLDTFIEMISFSETRNYVQQVLGNIFAYTVDEGKPGLSLLSVAAITK